jgi:AAA15 family ATPase/GTPase
MAYCVHKRGDKTVKLPMVEESSGTNGLFSVLALVLPVLDNGGVAIIDELETDLHPHMVEALLDLFVQPDSNPKNAQLIFASHADWLMDQLHKTQIVLVEKTEEGTEVFRLSDIKGVQARENYSARYRSGAYGAVPELS